MTAATAPEVAEARGYQSIENPPAPPAGTHWLTYGQLALALQVLIARRDARVSPAREKLLAHSKRLLAERGG